MTQRDLPVATVPVRPDVGSGISKEVINRWNPNIKAAAEDEAEATISVLDPIGADWYGDGVTSKRIGAALRNIGPDRAVTVNVNSPGGDYFEGLAIYNQLVEHRGHVTVKVLGLAASAASIIAMAGDDIYVPRSGFLMIHNTWVRARGDRNAFREVADWLEPFDQAAVSIYHARSGIPEKELATMLDKETWLNGKTAVDRGLADGLLEDAAATSSASNSLDGSVSAAVKRLDLALANAGFSRSEGRSLVAALKGSKHDAAPGGKQDAAPSGTHDAAFLSSAQSALDTLNSL